MGKVLAQVAEESKDSYKNAIILASVNGKLKELNEDYDADKKVEFITTATSIGNETYRRSVVFLMLAAINKIDLSRKINRVVVDYSLSKGLYCTFEGEFKPTQEFI